MSDFKRTKLHLIFQAEFKAIKHFFESVTLAKQSKWRDSADELVACATLFKGYYLQKPLEAACFYAEAADTYERVDKDEAMKTYEIAIKMYSDLGRFDCAGRLERIIAIIHYQSKHWEDAAMHYRKAADYLSGEREIDQSDFCFEQAANCLWRVGENEEAKSLYETVAKSCTATNLRKFNSRSYLLKAIICMFGFPIIVSEDEVIQLLKDEQTYNKEQRIRRREHAKRVKNWEKLKEIAEKKGESFFLPPIEDDPMVNENFVKPNTGAQTKYQGIKYQYDSYDDIDLLWRGSTEKKFVNNLLLARAQCHEHDFIDHIYYFNAVYPFNKYALDALKVAWAEIPIERNVKKKQAELQAKINEEERLREQQEAQGYFETRASLSNSLGGGKSSATGSGSFGDSGGDGRNKKEQTSISKDEGKQTSISQDGGGKSSMQIDENRNSFHK